MSNFLPQQSTGRGEYYRAGLLIYCRLVQVDEALNTKWWSKVLAVVNPNIMVDSLF